jgi:aminoglycoside N3'-acetyltransferase
VSQQRRKTTLMVAFQERKSSKAFSKIGLMKWALVGVHSPLSRFGHVEGVAEAMIDALPDVIGKDSTVVIVTFARILLYLT